MTKHKVNYVDYAIINEFKITNTSLVTNKGRDDRFLFQGCSFAKSLVAFAVIKLVQQNTIGLDEPIRLQIKTSFLEKNITPRHCLSMMSGLAYNSKIFHPNVTLDEILESVYSKQEPGKQYEYSGAGYMVLQKLIEETVGESFQVFMSKQFRAIGMEQSSFAKPLADDLEAKVISDSDWLYVPTTASGGLWTTAADMAKFAIAIAKQQDAKPLFQIQNQINYGLGLMLDGDEENFNFRKEGYNDAYHNQLIMFPYTGDGLVMLTTGPSKTKLIDEFIRYIAKEYKWPLFSANFDELSLTDNSNNFPNVCSM